ncbi:MAG: hypothetical protein CLLPBCKN_001820 [Chroococcidiopsis cubana SAG 39.79]|uniref:DUF1611 domain-containing protein n=1 Tax=Chroococcidiopsis cubana SAG 39.79 TaxID=388085 RepID=A0AB37UQG1_9CYAN|nr:DUF1611 domain-containing protein [Chroococcidiopsis cubana]MDZ4872432.1 hypothetical protein [Chroococcidiopsis cubana SAG 39.79]PSB65547.1 DUF1611 domain-containing protein [Chroococcidiopsis cubana CCALA 043]RUT13655.1 hypothetical protein DSM107010_09300 [Chroococcidiopsis cubana SAG 39.79]
MRLQAESRVAILLHDGIKGSQGKTGLALLRYSQAQIIAVIDRQCAGESLPVVSGINRDIPIVGSVEEALAYNPDILAIGIAPSGGILPPEWQQEVKQAVFAGLSIANGLHTPLATIPEFQNLRPGQWIWDVRQEPPNLSIASGQAQTLACRRVLAVGTDMGVGKMSACLELDRACQQRGLRSKFIATGQAGLMIAGDGIPLDAIRVDFAAGAVEQMVVQHGSDRDIVFVEGQGSLLHPGSTATLPLIRGTQPTHLVLVHRAGQTHIRNHPHVPIPALTDVVQLYEMVAKAAGAFADVPVAAIALNTFHLDLATARQAIEQAQAETGLLCTDVVRFGTENILDAIVK